MRGQTLTASTGRLAVREMQKNFDLSTGQSTEEFRLNLVIVGAEIGRMRGVL